MEIQMTYAEGEWSVGKELRIPLEPEQDEKLAKAVVAAVNRFLKQHGSPIQSQGQVQPVEAEANQAETNPEPEDMTSVPATVEPTVFEPVGRKGMLRLTCPACDTTFFHYSPQKVTEVTCRCGHTIQLDDMAPAKFYCPSCEKEYKLKTNSVQAEITSNCSTCGQLMTARWNAKRFRYEPHG